MHVHIIAMEETQISKSYEILGHILTMSFLKKIQNLFRKPFKVSVDQVTLLV